MKDWPSLMLVSDRHLADAGRLAGAAASIAAAGIRLAVQVREKGAEAAEVLRTARLLVDRARSREAAGRLLVVVNGRFDLALAAGADGVHLPSEGAPVRRVREVVGDRLVVGISTHSPEEVREAAAAGADYALFGPVFETPSKAAFGRPQGPERLRMAVAASAGMPLLAIGGIDGDNAGRCREAGAHGVAVIRSLLLAHDPVAAARRLTRDR